jgi:hypothetical protein
MVCFAILFVPETEIIYHHVAYGGQIKSLALISLFASACAIGFR